MTFQPSIPLATDLISVSQGDLKNNFTALDTAWNVNHVGFNATGAGKHKFVELPIQGSDPAGAVSEVTIYSKTSAGSSEIYMKRDAIGTPIQMTVGSIAASTTGKSFLPGGMIIQWGLQSAPTSNTQINFNTTFPNNCFTVTATPYKSGSITNITGFTVKQPPSSSGFTPLFSGTTLDYIGWIAIGN